jgi:cell division protein FtsB
MSAIIRAKRRKNPPASTAVLWAVLGMAVIFFLFSYGQELLLAHELGQKAAAQREANAALSDENTRLRSLLHYYSSDKYIEQRAREDLNLRRPDEKVLIPVLTAPEEQTEPAVGASAGATEISPDRTPAAAPEQANWQKWFALFSP